MRKSGIGKPAPTWTAGLWLLALVFVAGALSGCRRAEPEQTLTVATASSLAPRLERIVKDYQNRTGWQVRLSPGATTNLARQLRSGAPFDLFLGADVATADALAADGQLDPASVADFHEGRLVVWQRADAPHRLGSLEDLANPAIRRIAIANPDVAPYGRAARQALERAGLLGRVEARLIPTDDVRSALIQAQAGNCDAAFVAELLAPDGAGFTVPVPGELYDPIRHRGGVTARGANPEAARALFEDVKRALR